MRKVLSILLSLLLVTSLLSGCGNGPKTFRCMELSIELTGEFRDLSQDKAGTDFTFLYASDQIGIAGIREPKVSFSEEYADLTLEGYAELTAISADVAVKLQNYRGIPYYVYTAVLEDVEFTYVAAAFDDGFSYWLLQCYCQTSQYETLSPQMWQYLDSVRFQ